MCLMKHTIIIKDLEDIDRAAGLFLSEIGENKLIAFYAPMGAGKTTFTTALCRRLGVREDAVSSPTFAIVNEYLDGRENSIYHFDFYRIEKLEEVYDMGYEDYFYSGNVCFLEWPELIEDILPSETVRVTITLQADGTRTCSL